MSFRKPQDFMTFVSPAVNVQNMRQTIGREAPKSPTRSGTEAGDMKT